MAKNPYYHPEAFGLEVVVSHDFANPFDYGFDTRVVWRNKATGQLLTARDSGCSCPTPFDGVEPEPAVISELLDEARNCRTHESTLDYIETLRKLQ